MSTRQHFIKNSVETIQLPVPPGSFKIKSGKNSTSTNLLGFGEINDSGTPTLKTWSITSFFPARDYTFLQCTRKANPYDYCDLIEKLKNGNVTCFYIVTGTNINIPCTIEDFEYGEDDCTEDVSFTITFKEHKEVYIGTGSHVTGELFMKKADSANLSPLYKEGHTTMEGLSSSDSMRNTQQSLIYRVQTGDNLISIAKKVYGDSNKYETLLTNNNLKNVNDIRVNQELKL